MTVANANDKGRSPAQVDCDRCGATIERREWHPIRTDTIGGDLRIYAFCSEACRRAWNRPEQ
ncbi:DUF7576 family protein [Natronoarchaeum philippinense]